MSNRYSGSGFSILPPVVKNLIIINALMFILTLVLENMGIDLRRILGLHLWISPQFEPYQIVTHMFMHGSFMHLFMNMFSLWMFGSVLENLWGGRRFLLYYLITGLGASLLYSVVNYWEVHELLYSINNFLDSPTAANLSELAQIKGFALNSAFQSNLQELAQLGTTDALQTAQRYVQQLHDDYLQILPYAIGASGAVYGLLMAYGMLFPNQMVYIYALFPMKAKYFVLLFGIFELVMGIRGDSNVAHFAHLGGMLFGFLLIKYWQYQHKV